MGICIYTGKCVYRLCYFEYCSMIIHFHAMSCSRNLEANIRKLWIQGKIDIGTNDRYIASQSAAKCQKKNRSILINVLKIDTTRSIINEIDSKSRGRYASIMFIEYKRYIIDIHCHKMTSVMNIMHRRAILSWLVEIEIILLCGKNARFLKQSM